MRKLLFCLTAGLLLLPAAFVWADWDPGTPAKWIQLPDLDITGIDINASPFPEDYILADDFLCSERGTLTEIHIFGSWLDDNLPMGDPSQVMFTLSIHADIPAEQSPTGYSMPGEMLWMMEFQAGDFMVRPYMEMIMEGWMNPPEDYMFPADFTCWQYNFHIPPERAFIQEGSTDNPVVYWLDLKAMPMDEQAFFGWKTSVDHWNDDAVWGVGPEPGTSPWNELIYPPEHQFRGESIDLAFVLNGEPIIEELDFGDAPDTYRTLLASNGPRHGTGPLYLGLLVDSEPDGQPHPQALGDDLNNLPDEDGVLQMSPMIPGQSAQLGVTASQPGLLDAWIDWNFSGTFDAAEQIFSSQPLNAGLNPLTIMIPAGTPTTRAVIGRFRVSTSGGLSFHGVYPDGTVPDGEVEDHEFGIEEEVGYKWIQRPDLDRTGIDVDVTNMPEDFILADDWLCTERGRITEVHIFGSWVDDVLPGNGDPNLLHFTLSIHADIPAEQNPDGFSIPGEMLWMMDFQPGTFQARPFAEGIEEGWMIPPEYYIPPPADTICWKYIFPIDEALAFIQEGTPGQGIVYWLDVKAYTVDGIAMFGWKTSLDHWNDDAVWGIGPDPYSGPWRELRYPPGHPMAPESIDLAFGLVSEPVPVELDFGDAPDTYRTLLASNGPRHGIGPLYLGQLVDSEPDGLPHPQALGDDFNNLPDEDGVVQMSPMIPGQSAQLGITASQPGLLDAWVDWDGSGTFDAAEQIFSSQALNTGLNPLTIMVPAGTPANRAVIGRFRVSTGGGLSFDSVYPDGTIPDGEVEDHEFGIEEEVGYKWFQKPDLDLTGIDVNASPYQFDYILADDFLCTERGLLTEIHVFGSWLGDNLPQGDPNRVTFVLSIHDDIPADQNPDGYSIPDVPLWWMEFQPGAFEVRPWREAISEGWLNPPEDFIPPPADTICWQYKFFIDPTRAFLQEGTPDNPRIYWLDVKAHPMDADGQMFGWKTSLDHWNDDAVWGFGFEPYPGPWYELIYPPGHPMEMQSIDLAFGIVSEPPPIEYDWGDAADPSYPTLAINNGPYHQLSPLFLGAQIDGESNGQPTFDAMGDDLNGLDDEDGVTFTSPLKPAKPATVDVVASQAGGLLDAWIDYDNNGSFADPGEQIFTSLPLNFGTNNLTFNVPAVISENTTVTTRWRVSSGGGLSFDGIYPDGTIPNGEVEDHTVFLEDRYTFKWIQHPDLSTQGIDVCATKFPTHADGFVLADDFRCTRPGPLTDIHVWGSWRNDQLPDGSPRNVRFNVSIHEDIPAAISPTGYSMPGEILWIADFHPDEFEVEMFAEQIEEGFMYPPGDYFFPADWTCWLYKFHVDPHLAFEQKGTEAAPVVYWLDIQAEPLDGVSEFGWKTSMDHWNDDAVWGWGSEPWPGPWNELIYPPQHQLGGLSIDLAFALFEDYITDVPEDVPTRTGLLGNTPNPFNPMTVIKYAMPEGGGDVKLEVFDARGRLVATLVDGFVDSGPKSVTWYGRDDGGQEMPSGVYFYRLTGPGIREALKMLLLR